VKIAVAILNWNGENMLQKFLPNIIEKSNKEIAEIFLIDNNSVDNSVETVRKQFPEVKLILLDKNYGFADGYNRGLRQIEAEYYFLLNSDVEVTDNYLETLLELMESDKNIAICGPKLLDYNNRTFFEYAGAAGGFVDKYGYPFCRGRVFETMEADCGQYDDLSDCMWISGAALFVRADLYKVVGGLDALFFAHQEEIDLCWRLKNLGYRVVYQPNSIIFHVGAATLKKSNPNKTFLNFKNNLLLINKNFPKKKKKKILFIRVFLDAFAALRMLWQRRPKEFVAVIKAYFYFWLQKNKTKGIRKRLNPIFHSGFYNKSIVLQYFVKNKKTFSNLN
jgi:GT2 family glycosyltransferase